MLFFPLPASAGQRFSGDHGEKVTPVPIPNTAVKGLIGEGTAGVARGRVARCRDLFQGAAGRLTCGPFFVPASAASSTQRRRVFLSFSFPSLMLTWSFCQLT